MQDTMTDSMWTKKGATLSDKSARKEYGLTQEEIVKAIRSNKLQYRYNHVHGNPYFRLLRHEVESLVNRQYGKKHLEKRRFENELAQVNKDLKRTKAALASLEKRKVELTSMLGKKK